MTIIRKYEDHQENDDRLKSVAEVERHARLTAIAGLAGVAIIVPVAAANILAVMIYLAW